MTHPRSSGGTADALDRIWDIVHTPTKATSHRSADRHFMADFDAIRQIIKDARAVAQGARVPKVRTAEEIIITPEMVSAGMAEIPEDGAEYEHVEAAYRKMAALALSSTDRNLAEGSRCKDCPAPRCAVCPVPSTNSGGATKHSGTYLGYKDQSGNEMHCANAFCPHQDKCLKGCVNPVAVPSTTSGSAAK